MNSNQKSRQNHRSGRQNNKQNNRGRNQNARGGRKGPSNKQSQQPLTASKQVDSYGPAGKLRGNVKQLYDKYHALAIETRTKDSTDSEAYGQYAHHYFSLYSEFAAAEAAQQVERENEKKRKQQEAAENQSNVVAILDEDGNIASDVNSSSETGGAPKATEEPAAKKHIKPRRTAKKTRPENAPELPLEASEQVEKPKRVRKPRKIKEDVAE
jgi:Domain of unknown function (DUF4167)